MFAEKTRMMLAVIVGVAAAMMTADAQNAPLRRPISVEKPLFIVLSISEYNAVPADLKPFAAVCYDNGGSPTPNATVEAFVADCESKSIYCIIQTGNLCNGCLSTDCMTVVGGRYMVHDPQASFADGTLFAKYPHFLGYTWCEAMWEGRSAINLYMADQIRVAAKNGGYFVWADCGAWQEPNSALVETFRQCRNNVIFCDKKTASGDGFYWNTASCAGYYLAGQGNWGVSPDGWIWQCCCGATCQGNDQNQHPGTLQGLQMLNGIADGGLVYRNFEVASSGIFSNVLFPLWRKMISSRLIPTLSAVRSSIKMGYRGGSPNQGQIMGGLYASSLWFPQTGRYHIVPVFNPNTQDAEASFCQLGTSGQFTTTYFNPIYPGDGESGNSWIRSFPSRGLYLIANPNETNQSTRTSTFSLPLRRNSCKSLSGTFQSYTFATVEEFPESVQVQMCNYLGNCQLTRPNTTTFVLKGVNETREPALTISGQTSYTKNWNAATQEYTLTVTSNGTVYITCRTSGTPTTNRTPSIAARQEGLAIRALCGGISVSAPGLCTIRVLDIGGRTILLRTVSSRSGGEVRFGRLSP